MLEAEHESVKRLAGEAGRRLECPCFGLGLCPRRLARSAIRGVADQRVSQMGQVDADLVRAARLETAFDEARDGTVLGAERLQHAIARPPRPFPKGL